MLFAFRGMFIQAQNKQPEIAPASAEPQQPTVTEPSSTEVATAPVPPAPIDLRLVPAGASILIHLRPAEIWAPGSLGEECLRCLGPLGERASATIRELCRYEPGELEEVLLCLIPGPRGTAPDVAVVARLVQAQPEGELLQKFTGTRNDDQVRPIYIDAERAILIRDDRRTFAAAPSKFADELAEAVDVANPTAPGVEAILAQTDRSRHVTVVFNPVDVRLHADMLFSPELAEIAGVLLDWLGDDVETVAWSARFDDEFSSELVLRNRDARTERQLLPQHLLAEVRGKLAEMPAQVLQSVQAMEPRHSGKRTLIGRFPAMLKVV
jgi:hypothetical protein